jgi:molybdopterin synthase sulfur carrier subunit
VSAPRRVRVLYFAAVRDVVGCEEEVLEPPSTVGTVRDFTVWIGERHVALAPRMGSVRIARNEAFASDDDAIEDGDVLALIPPVAGG